ncbi:hypothetical protein D3C85_1886500 [compost metagenome]
MNGDALARQCPSKRLNAARRDRAEAEQAGMTKDLDTWIGEARSLMIEIATETSSA